MEQETNNKNYEFAYHLNPDIEETDIRRNVQELENIMTQNGGTVFISVEPKKKHLSYPLKHKHYSYFGHINFSVGPEKIEKINAQMMLQHNVVRYLLTEMPNEKNLRLLGAEKQRSRLRTHEASAPGREDVDGKKKEEVKPGQIEKEIEDVLEKI